MITKALHRYFVERYPRRERSGISRWFRAGEAARRDVIGPWLAEVRGHVLDVGTGDGRFLASVLPARVAELSLVDLAARPLGEAARLLANRAPIVRAIEGDIDAIDPPVADVVIALGITDYLPDWAPMIRRFRANARSMVIVDFPRARTIRSVARRAWLGWHGIPLHTGSRADVDAGLANCEVIEVIGTRLHWIARVSGGVK